MVGPKHYTDKHYTTPVELCRPTSRHFTPKRNRSGAHGHGTHRIYGDKAYEFEFIAVSRYQRTEPSIMPTFPPAKCWFLGVS